MRSCSTGRSSSPTPTSASSSPSSCASAASRRTSCSNRCGAIPARPSRSRRCSAPCAHRTPSCWCSRPITSSASPTSSAPPAVRPPSRRRRDRSSPSASRRRIRRPTTATSGRARRSTAPRCCAVEAFVEKPDAATAAGYVAEDYLWNSGNFLFHAATMLAEIEHFEPEMAQAAKEAVAGIAARPRLPAACLPSRSGARRRSRSTTR